MGTSAKDIKDRLDLIVDRRNKIAHEADIDPSYPDTRWPIDEQLVSDTVGFIEQKAVFAAGKSVLTTNEILEAIKNTHSLSEIMKEPLEKMSKEYETRKFKNASV